MAIALGNYAENLTGSGTSASVTLDATALTGRFVYAMTRSSNDVTTATYGGVSMTKIASADTGGGEWKGMFYLVNPPSGSNTLTVNSGSSTSYLRIAAQSITGINAVENTNSSLGVTTGTSANISVTTIVVNAWVVGGAGDNGAGAVSAGTGTVAIGTGENALRLFQRNDNPQVTPGSKTMNFTSNSGSSKWGMFSISISPSSTVNSNFLAFM